VQKATTSTTVGGLQSEEKGLFSSWDFENNFGLVAMKNNALQLARTEDFFEGWYVDENTLGAIFDPRPYR